MAAMEVDADQVAAYAKTAATAATELAEVITPLTESRLSNDAFGELGRTVRSAEAYSKASGTLFQQLSRAVDALHSASAGLDQVAESHRSADEDNARTISRSHQR